MTPPRVGDGESPHGAYLRGYVDGHLAACCYFERVALAVAVAIGVALVVAVWAVRLRGSDL